MSSIYTLTLEDLVLTEYLKEMRIFIPAHVKFRPKLELQNTF
jgi:hypothetical protein